MGHTKPGAILLLKANKNIPDYENFFKRPDSFNKMFDFTTLDNKKATVWTLNCPAHYRALGVEVSLNDEDGNQVIPDGTVYCIKASFTDHPEWVEELRVTPERSDSFSLFS